MVLVGASICENQQYTQKKMYIIVQTDQTRIIRTNPRFRKDNIRTTYTMEVFDNSHTRIKANLSPFIL